MKRRIMGNFSFDIASKRKTFRDRVEDKLASMPMYDSSLVDGEDDEGNPQTTVDIRPEAFDDADSLFEFLKEQTEKIPWLHGRFTIHNCEHDSPNPRPCRIEQEVSG